MDNKKKFRNLQSIQLPEDADFGSISEFSPDVIKPVNRATMALPRAFDNSLANAIK
jgi:hypothetical protein